jgi:hypothetical protein
MLTPDQIRFAASMFERYLIENIENLERDYLNAEQSIPFVLYCCHRFAELQENPSFNSEPGLN